MTTITLPSPCLVVLVGVAGSGKSTWAARNFEASHIVSSDAIRALVGEGEGDQAASKDAFAILDEVVERRLARKLTTVIDTLGLDPKRRQAYRAMAAHAALPCVAVAIEIDPARVRRRNRSRTKRVPDKVVTDQLATWQNIPATLLTEGFEAVHLLVPPQDPPHDGPQDPPHDGPERRAATAAGLAPADAPVVLPAAQSDNGPAATLVPAGMIRTAPAPLDHPVPNGAKSVERALRFGLQISRFDFAGGPAEVGERLGRIVQTAERCGFESVWVMDHFRMPPQVGRAWDDMLESYTTLAFLAARTTTIRLGTLVTGITYRNVAHLGKIVATLDVLSGGRANCGIGLGWFKQEHEGYGWVLPSVAERYSLVEDALALLPQMWGPGNKPFAGTVLSVPDTTCYPRPLQAHIPLLLGGSGEHRTLRLVARHADACNLFGEAPELRRKLGALARHCDDAGRDPADIDVTHLSSVLVADTTTELASLIERRRPRSMSAERFARSANAGTIGQHVDRLANLSEAGVQLEIVSLADLQGPEQIERFGDVIDAFR